MVRQGRRACSELLDCLRNHLNMVSHHLCDNAQVAIRYQINDEIDARNRRVIGPLRCTVTQHVPTPYWGHIWRRKRDYPSLREFAHELVWLIGCIATVWFPIPERLWLSMHKFISQLKHEPKVLNLTTSSIKHVSRKRQVKCLNLLQGRTLFGFYKFEPLCCRTEWLSRLLK